MSLEQLPISFLFFAIVFICFVKKVNKRWKRLTFSGIAGVLLIISLMFFLRQHFIPFNSPEEAYKYVYGGETFLVIEGTDSDYVIGNKDAKYLNKSQKGWTVPILKISITKGMKQINSATIYVSQYNFSEEYYVTVLDLENSSLNISDNRNSIFYKSNISKDILDEKSCAYYAYVNKINDEYTISVNGEEVKLLE